MKRKRERENEKERARKKQTNVERDYYECKSGFTIVNWKVLQFVRE